MCAAETGDVTGFDTLILAIEKTGKRYDIEKITRAYEYAKALHEGQFRVSGEPYITHPVAVAEIVTTLGLDTDSICAALASFRSMRRSHQL